MRKLLAGLLFAVPLALPAQDLLVQARAQEVRVKAPEMHFLTGRALDRLKNGATVIFEIQLSLAVDSKSNALRRSIERFAVSYDLWEERFAVIGLRQGSKAVSHLSAQAAEVWCLDQLAVPTSGIAPERPVWLRLEIRAEESNERIDGDSDASVDLARLVELFSRGGQRREMRWSAEHGPVRLGSIPSPAGGEKSR
ncbi:MAG: hypothetical protein ACK5AZ_21010 [Bryobacteraceae bacterium]